MAVQPTNRKSEQNPTAGKIVRTPAPDAIDNIRSPSGVGQGQNGPQNRSWSEVGHRTVSPLGLNMEQSQAELRGRVVQSDRWQRHRAARRCHYGRCRRLAAAKCERHRVSDDIRMRGREARPEDARRRRYDRNRAAGAQAAVMCRGVSVEKRVGAWPPGQRSGAGFNQPQ